MTYIAPLVVLLSFAAAAHAGDAVLAEVNGQKLTGRDLSTFLAVRGVRKDVSPAFRKRATTELVDRELVRQFLQRRKTTADPDQLASALRAAKRRLSAGTEDADAALRSRGIDESRLKRELALSIAWRRHVRRIVTETRIREYFEAHRRELDGTRLRVSQIFLAYETGESTASAAATKARLQRIRDEVEAGTLTFADAAKANSQSPSASAGGDVGMIGARGDLPASVTTAAYRLEPGEVSEVILSPLGAHLVTVTKVEPGDLSLEDVRPTILDALSQSLWQKTVAAERKNAKIVLSKPTIEVQ